MHELSIAAALLNQLERHAPADAVVRTAHVTAGPLRALEPESMQMAWRAVTQQTRFDGVHLDLKLIPWRLHCTTCDRRWQSDDPLAACTCGNNAIETRGSGELVLYSIDVDDEASNAALRSATKSEDVP